MIYGAQSIKKRKYITKTKIYYKLVDQLTKRKSIANTKIYCQYDNLLPIRQSIIPMDPSCIYSQSHMIGSHQEPITFWLEHRAPFLASCNYYRASDSGPKRNSACPRPSHIKSLQPTVSGSGTRRNSAERFRIRTANEAHHQSICGACEIGWW